MSNSNNVSFGNDLPLGFGMALAQNPSAMNYFSSLSEEQKRKIIDGTRNIKSKQEMRSYVNSIANNSTNNSFQG